MKTVNILIISIVLIIIAFMAYSRAGKIIKNQAVDSCLASARVNVKTSDTQTVTAPEGFWYKFCMEKKGYKE